MVPRALWLVMAVGAAVRLVAAFSGVGVFASDDYFHVIEPAWRWLSQPDAPLPSDFRSELMPRILWAVFSLERMLGVPEPARMLQGAYAVLGLWSVLAIPGAYVLARPALGHRAALGAAWLVALQAFLPRVSTRALVETAAVPPLVWGLALAEWARRRPGKGALGWAAGAGLLLGMASMFRFQVGLVWAGAALVLLVAPCADGVVEPASRQRARLLAGMVAGGALAALLQGLLDLHTHGVFLASPVRYLAFNLENSAMYGAAPWYTFLLFFLAASMPPAIFVLGVPAWRTARELPVTTTALVLFVALHSAIQHKEERFMFSVLPLLAVVLGAAMVEAWNATRLQRLGVVAFCVMNGVLLVLFTFSDSKRNMTVPLLDAAAQHPKPVVVGVGKAMQLLPFYLGEGGRVFQAASVPEALNVLDKEGKPPARLMLRTAPTAEDQAALQQDGWSCTPPQLYGGDLYDQLLVAVNPSHNPYRMPLHVMDCAVQSGT